MKTITRSSVVTLALLAGLAPTAAVAAWQSASTGTASVSALSLEAGNAPTAQRSNGTVVLDWVVSTLSDGLTGVSSYDVIRHGESDVTVCPGVTVTQCVDEDPEPGPVTYGVVPRIGTHWEGAESVATEFRYDEFAPVTEVTTRTPEPNSAGWNREDVSVTLTASDPDPVAAGVGEVHYTLGGTETVVAGATATFTVSQEQVTEIEFWAVDELGNTETRKSTAAVKIDKTAPTTVATVTGTSGSNGWYTSEVLVTFGADDVLSGVSATEYSTSGSSGPWSPYTAAGVPVSAEGSSTVHFRSTDVAGNLEAVKSQLVRIDRVAPVSSASQAGSLVTLTAEDANSGVGSIVYRLGSASTYTTYSEPFSLPAGETVHFHAVDVAGNVEATDNSFTSRDLVGPAITNVLPGDGSSWTNTNPRGTWGTVCDTGRVCATVTDSESGVDATRITYVLSGAGTGVNAGKCWNGSNFVAPGSSGCAPQAMALDVTTSRAAGEQINRNKMDAGTYSLTVRAVDLAGNVSSVTVTFSVTAGS